jgi:hypothetical protein
MLGSCIGYGTESRIGWIAAHSSQAQGRVERFFGTAQDRLVKGLRLAQSGSSDALRQLRAEHQLAAILSRVEERCVAAIGVTVVSRVQM